jgi:hypothetical protein
MTAAAVSLPSGGETAVFKVLLTAPASPGLRQ